MSLAVVIMAAGKGTRMKSSKAKVLHELNGRALIEHVLNTAKKLNPSYVVLIVGHQAEEVQEATSVYDVAYALQQPQLGTGHAVMQAESTLNNFDGDVLILSGDVPLVSYETLNNLVSHHKETKAVATVLTTELVDPTGYGRVVRDKSGSDVLKIVEHKDASEAERAINEINSGIYVFHNKRLFNALNQVDNNNAQGEYYLPDVFKLFFKDRLKISAIKTPNFNEIRGINTVEQLEEAEKILLSAES
jgi:UDP-N-acetylglucosamine pyrophosphorylase